MITSTITGISSYTKRSAITRKFRTESTENSIIWFSFIIRFQLEKYGTWNHPLYGHTHDSMEDTYYQECLRKMAEEECSRHIYECRPQAYNVDV